jgi:hypothetical protein
MNNLVLSGVPEYGSEEWEVNFDDNSNKVIDWLDAIAQEHGIESSVWSMWNFRDFTAIPFPGITRMKYDGSWGEPCGTNVPENATWLDLWKAADALIKKSGDDHHIFIELMYVDDSVITFSCGS